ncbi:hypothetical protein Scep_020591 [Stephania cephalantha]|uniref:AAA+ ATPase domain-containing protein n=1 Tax=Stephania cephalantha TaxID=152367 RepID=A0AAP0IE67_9MAGN
MLSLSKLLSTSTLFNAYTSLSAFVMLFRTIVEELIPNKLQDYIGSRIRRYNPFSSEYATILVDEAKGLTRNEVYSASETYYLRSRIDSSVRHLRVMKEEREQDTTCLKGLRSDGKTYKDRDKVVSKYLPHVLSRANAIKKEDKVVKLHTLSTEYGESEWDSINMGHPASFDTLAMDPEMKKDIMQDLDRFVGAKDFYKRVGKAWKRGYLLYGPPGTGKSSLIAAMANYLKFDVYDLELSSLTSDSELRQVLIATANRSILIVEDIDCAADLKRNKGSDAADSDSEDSHGGNSKAKNKVPWTLSGLLNLTDVLWSGCGEERIIVFTTNHKDRLDPALLRPGRIDKHIHMSYLTMKAFDVLAMNYLGIKDGRHQHEMHFKEIEDLLEKSLGGLVNFLKRKNMDKNEAEDEEEVEDEEGIQST